MPHPCCLQAELNQKVADLSAALDATLQAHLEQELLRTTSRAHEVVAPFASLVDAAVAAQERGSAFYL